MKLNKTKSIDSLNYISTITNNNNNVKFSQRSIANGLENDKLIANRQPCQSSNIIDHVDNNDQHSHNSIVQLTKLNKNQSFESYLIQMHKFLKEKKLYLEPNETYKRRTVVLIRPTYSFNSSTSSESSFMLNKSKSVSQFYSPNNQNGEFGFNLQSYGLLNSNTKQTEYICFINNVQPKSVAKKAGLNNGDILLAIDQIKTNEFKSFSDIMKHVKGKNELRLVILTEHLCKKINLQQRIDQIKSVLADKRNELEQLKEKKNNLFKKYNTNEVLVKEESSLTSPAIQPDDNSTNLVTTSSPAEFVSSKDQFSTDSSSGGESSSIYLSPVSSSISSASSDEPNKSVPSISSDYASNNNKNDGIENHENINDSNSVIKNTIHNSTPNDSSNTNSLKSFDSTPSFKNDNIIINNDDNQQYRVIYNNDLSHNEVGIDVIVDNKSTNNESIAFKSFDSTTTNNSSSFSSSDHSSNNKNNNNNNIPVKKSSFIRKYIETATNNLTRSLSSNSMNLISNIKVANSNGSVLSGKNQPSSANLRRKKSNNIDEMLNNNKRDVEFKTSLSSSSIINNNDNNNNKERYKIILNDITTTSSNTDDDLKPVDSLSNNTNFSNKKTYYRSNSGIKTKNLINLFSLNRSSTSYLSERNNKLDESKNSDQTSSVNKNLFGKKRGLFNKLNVSDNNLTYKNDNNTSNNNNSNNSNSSNITNKLKMFNLLANKPIKIINTQKLQKSNNNIITIDLKNINNDSKDINNNINSVVVIKSKNQDSVGPYSNNDNTNNSGGSGYGSACTSLLTDYSSVGSPDQNSMTTSSTSSSNSSYRTTPSSNKLSSNQSSIASVTCNSQNQQSTPTAKITCPISYYHRSVSVDSNLNNDSTIARIISNGYNFKLNDPVDSFKIPSVLNYSNQDYTITRL